jgi:hypothetical protein
VVTRVAAATTVTTVTAVTRVSPAGLRSAGGPRTRNAATAASGADDAAARADDEGAAPCRPLAVTAELCIGSEHTEGYIEEYIEKYM